MRYLLVTDSPLAATIVSSAASAGESLTILCAEPSLARRLRRRGHHVLTGRLEQPATWKRVAIDEETLVVVALEREAAALDVVKQVNARLADAPVVMLDAGHEQERAAPAEDTVAFRNVERVRLTDVVRAPFQQKFANARVRKRVHEWRDHFQDADRVLILLHDDPDPDGLAAALALRALLGRNRQTAIIGTFKPPTRPENVRMVELLGLDVTKVADEDLATFSHIAVVDTQPHIFGSRVPHADLVIDHHPPRTGYTATFKDIRTACGATSSLLIDYLIRFGIPISERIATAAVYAIKTDTWTFRRGTVPEDVAIFAHVYPRADQAMLRRIEMAGFNLETLHHISRVEKRLERVEDFLYVHLGEVPREDLVPTIADFLLTLAEARWTAVSGVLDDTLTISIRNLGYQRSAGELVQQVYGEIASAGGHRSAAKAVIPLAVAQERFGDHAAPDFPNRLFRPLWETAQT